MVYCCSVCGNEESSKNPHLTFHSLPKDETVKKEWLKVMNKKNVKAAKVCSIHFRDKDYRALCDKPLLKRSVIPQLFIPAVNLQDLCLAESEMSCIKSVNNDINYVVPTTFGVDQKTTEGILEREKETVKNVENVQNTANISGEECTTSFEKKRGLKRSNDSFNESGAPSKKFCCFKEYGTFRRDNFVDDDSWDRFLQLVKGFRKQELQLERQNKCLLRKVLNLRDIVEQLKQNNLQPR